MRVWNEIPPENLCKNHLIAEHRETLCIFSVITKNKKGYSNHPEVVRYRNHIGALRLRHNEIIKEAKIRGYHFKDLPFWYPNTPIGIEYVSEPESWDNQIEKLGAKNCQCIIECSRGNMK